MEQKVYIFTDPEKIDCYYNLKQLAEDNPKVSYHYAQKCLEGEKTIKIKDYTIAIRTMRYHTKRHFTRPEE